MNHELALRVVLAALFVLLLPIGLRYRIKSQATGEKLDRRQEGLFILATLRPAAAVLWFGLIAWMIDPRSMEWASISVPLWARWAGVALFALGSALVIWTFRSLGANLTDTVVTRQSHTLVFHGPYRWVRHPLYDAVALLTVATSLATANWFLFLCGVLVLCLLVLRTRTEEDNLVARFGNGYREYMERTGPLLPRFRAQRSETTDGRPETKDQIDRVQCPNCCKLAPVTARRMGLLYFRCELCGSVGATPDPREAM